MDDAGLKSQQYGLLKKYIEDLVLEMIPNSIIVRPSVVLGPGDNSGRLDRIYKEYIRGNILYAPTSEDGSLITKFIDVRDLVNLIFEIVRNDMTGQLHLVSKIVLWNDFLQIFASVVGSDLTFAEEEFFPLWDTTRSNG